MRKLAIPAIATAAVIVAALAGCSQPATSSAQGDTLRVVATTTQVADFTSQVGGDLIDLRQLIAPNASAHHFDPTAADLTALATADVLVVSGAGLEEWLDSAIEASGFHGTVIDSSQGIELSGGHDHEDAESEDADHAEADHAEEDHDHAAGNPHIWTDPNNAKVMVENIANGLSTAAPQDASAFEENAAAYNAKLTELDTWIRDNIDTVPVAERLVVSNHDAFHYYLDRYDVTFVGSIIPSFEDNAEPSAAEIDALVAAIKDKGVKAIFSEASVSEKTAAAIAKAAGVEVYSGENALFGDSLGAPGSGGETYIAATIHNTDMFLKSWGVAASAVPTDLLN